MKTRFTFLMLLAFIFFSCSSKEEKEIITKKIQYDVRVKSLNTNYDPWIENIPSPDRFSFVQQLLDAAYKGEIEVYDYFNKALSLTELKSLGVDTMYKTLPRSYPPYEEYDTIIVNRFSIQDINKIRFLEEWSMDKNRLTFDKKVIGIAPVIDKYDQHGNLLGKQPLFWIYPEGKPK